VTVNTSRSRGVSTNLTEVAGTSSRLISILCSCCFKPNSKIRVFVGLKRSLQEFIDLSMSTREAIKFAIVAAVALTNAKT
jgi:hypothetical protein